MRGISHMVVYLRYLKLSFVAFVPIYSLYEAHMTIIKTLENKHHSFFWGGFEGQQGHI